jgi:hypothetical protein
MHSPIDARADIYAVGVMLWEALGQRRRRLADTPAATYQARIAGLDPKIRDVCPDVPTALAEICDKATAPDPAERYSTAAEFQRDLEEILDQASRPPGQREMAALLMEHFEEEQTQRRARVQELLSGTLGRASLTPARGSASQSAPAAIYDLPGVDVQLHSEKPRALSDPRLRKTVAIGGAIVLTLGVAAALLSRSKDHVASNATGERKTVTESSLAQPSAPSAEDPAKKNEPATVQLFIQVRPSIAVVTLDGARIAATPFQADVQRDKGVHMLHASAPGYLPLEQVITYSNDTHLEIALRPAGGKASRGPEEGRSATENRNSRPAEPATEPKKSVEPEAEVKHRSATPPRGIDEKNPYAQ